MQTINNRMNDPIDIVVTYVDCEDPVWLKTIAPYENSADSRRRYRPWGGLKYWLRCVDQNMKFIRRVHVVVSNPEQVPEYVDSSKVNIVLHKDIIPETLLPTFNSTTIEMYLCKIQGLAEHFIYSNDDMFAIKPFSESDFFSEDGLPKYQLIHKQRANTLFLMQCLNSHRLASRLSGSVPTSDFFFTVHSMTPMLRSAAEEIHRQAGREILQSCSKFREPFNFTQYLFPDYAVLSKKAILSEQQWFKYFYAADMASTRSDILRTIVYRMVCINDVGKVGDYMQCRERLVEIFETAFPSKSQFEK